MDTVAGASRVAVDGEVLGNNQYIAQLIRKEVGGDLFSIETVQEYPTTHEPLLEFAYEEKADNARPELATQIEDPDSYDVIFLGYPNWNADLPMLLYTFLEEYDFSGKTIIPFTTHGGIAFARSLHIVSAFWGFVLMALHLGLHWNMVLGMVRKATGTALFGPIKAVPRAAAFLIAGYGGYAFIKNQFPSYMFLTSHFVFFGFEKPVLLFFTEYTAVMGLFVFLTYYALRGIQRLS